MAALVGLLLAAAAISLAWLLYRLERLHARHRDLDGALAVLLGAKRGMIERVGDDVAWAELYFSTVYTIGDDSEAQERADEAEQLVKERWPTQVFPSTACSARTPRFVTRHSRPSLGRDRVHRKRGTLACRRLQPLRSSAGRLQCSIYGRDPRPPHRQQTTGRDC